MAVDGQCNGPQARAEAICVARMAALADDGMELDKTLVKYGAAPLPVEPQPIMWVKKRRGATA